jgi:hypothetical protein
MTKFGALIFLFLVGIPPLSFAAGEDVSHRRQMPTDLVDKPENREHARLRQGLRKGKLTRDEARRLRQNRPAGKKDRPGRSKDVKSTDTPPSAKP